MSKGRLFLCATPIGNLADISLRTLETLKNVDLIACEDTRQTRKLLNYYDIKKPLTSYHEHNKSFKGPKIVDLLLAGEEIALVSDAGMPGISDPGADLVLKCIQEGIEFTVLPGPVALISGLVLSGLKTDRFCFEGFLPRTKKEKKKYFKQLVDEERTIIFYEAPHRLLETLDILATTLGDRQIAVCRELTKKFEEVFRGTVAEASEYYSNREIKGEFTLVLEGGSPREKGEGLEWALLRFEKLIAEGFVNSEAVKIAAKEANISKRELYQMVMKK